MIHKLCTKEAKITMETETDELEFVKDVVKRCLNELYTRDSILFSLNKNDEGISEGICERCIVFRFAYYLQKEIDIHFSGYIVDCDYDSSFTFDLKNKTSTPNVGKKLLKKYSPQTDRSKYVDIIVHKREDNPNSDFFCFEFKKWNRGTQREREEDIYKIEQLTSHYNYRYGFFLEFGARKDTTKWTIYQRDFHNRIHINNELVFGNDLQTN